MAKQTSVSPEELQNAARGLGTLIDGVRVQREDVRTALKKTVHAASAHTTNGQPSGVYEPFLDGLSTACKRVDSQLANLEARLLKQADGVRKHAEGVAADEHRAAAGFKGLEV
jgi:hypothetical protein